MRRILVSAIALALAGVGPVALAAPSASAATAPAVEATTQLPRDVRPSHYQVSVTPHADSLSFDGQVTIAIEVLQPTDRIVLNAVDMSFSSVALTDAAGKPVGGQAATELDADAQTASFVFGKALAAGKYSLALAYSGKIGTQANGLFAIDYDTAEGKKRALYTQFENSDARKFIPSWDEPNYKAVFDLTVTVPAAQMAVSNMPAAETRDLGKGMKQVRFQTSPKMSTYLLFFGLGDFDRATAMAEGTELGVVVQKGKVDQAKFALESASAVLREYNDYFATPYPLPKLDNIASPGRSQFFGAMENWGAIYTFEYALLLDPSISTQADKQSVFSIAAHEMAHQWFGDLVTMSWWDDLWLNEGFATWMAGRTTQKLHPEWNTELYEVEGREAAMSRDAVASTHPVVQHVETVEQASQAFDAITYQKGGAVIRMLERYVGADAWREGVRGYMKTHAYGNTVSDDLWRAVQTAAGKPILDIAHDFTLQPGVPTIRVEQARCVGGATEVDLAQGEFTKDRPDKAPLAWRVPVIAATVGSDQEARMVVSGGRGHLTVPGCGALVVNAGQSGYYRTIYGDEQMRRLTDQFAQLAPIDQLGLLGDSWALGMAGVQPVSRYLALADAAPASADPQVWADIAGGLAGLDSYFDGDPARQARLRKFAIAKLAPVFARLGWQPKAGESDPVGLLRMSLIGTLSALGDADVIAEARRLYAAQTKDPEAVPVALRKVVMAIVARNADAVTWDELHARARAEKTPLIKDQLYSLLSAAEDEALARKALELALTDEPGATNSASMISIVSRRHPDLAFDFAVAHQAQVDALVDSTSRSRYYPGLGGGSSDAAMIDKLKAFADAHIAASSRRATETAIGSIVYRRQVRELRMPEVDAWLLQRDKK